MALDPGLLEILACPDDKGPLRYFRDEDLLYNPRLGRTYPIQDGIPVLLISEAQALDDDERQRLSHTQRVNWTLHINPLKSWDPFLRQI